MARGVRTNITMLPAFSPGLQPQSVASFDPITRRNTILVATIVPTLNLAEAAGGAIYPADRFYAPLGLATSSGQVPIWVGAAGGTQIFNQWDATAKQSYLTLDTSGTLGTSAPTFVHYLGHGGQATSYAPKNVDVSEVRVRWRGRFPTSADYTVYGFGANSSGTLFNTATDHFFQVTRNTTNWELGSCDGSTISQSSAAGGDSSLHEFEVRWNVTNLRLYVDGTLTITKTTNMPTKALAPCAANNTDNVDIVDVSVEWY